MNVETYASALKKLIRFTKTKSTYLADHVDYDVSYISKWSNGTKLPSSRSVEQINSEMGVYFSRLIQSQTREDAFKKAFALPSDTADLAFEISQYLGSAYRSTLQKKPVTSLESKSLVRIMTGHHNTAQFISGML